MLAAFLLGRLVVGGFYLFNASNHFLSLEMQTDYARSKGVPAPKASVVVGGVLLLIGGLSILLGLWPTVGVLALLVFFLPVTFMMHAFWQEEDPEAQQNEMINFMKNMALMGSALMFLAIPQPWPLSVG